jgi:hypothetical protein
MAWVRARLCKLQKRVHSTHSASDKVYQLLAHGRWFSPGTPASSTTKTGRHDIAEILLKVALNTKNQSINQSFIVFEMKLTEKRLKSANFQNLKVYIFHPILNAGFCEVFILWVNGEHW